MLNWYPGHMAKALREIREIAKFADLFIVVLDARAPISTYNLNFDQIAPETPRLLLISKSDLGDSSKYEHINRRFNNPRDVVLFVDLKNVKARTRILRAIKRCGRVQEDARTKPLRVFVLGAPNSGKSTLINLLSRREGLRTGNIPGVTRRQQWVNIDGSIQMLDTPGILWPENNDEEGLFAKLIIIGSIRDEVFAHDVVYRECYRLLSRYYPDKLMGLGGTPQLGDVDIYNSAFELARRRGFYKKGSILDERRAMSSFINDAKKIRGVTFEEI